MRRRLCLAIGVVAGAFAGQLLLAPAGHAQAADDGLRAEGTTTYQFEPSAGVVHVTIDLVLRNTVPNHRDGNVINQTYFSAFGFPVPLGGANFAATSGDEALAVTSQPIDGSDTLSRVEVAFADGLFYDETLDLRITYDLTGEAPRSAGASRINPAYASFVVYAVGDPGLATVRVVIPESYELDSFGDLATETNEGDDRVLTAAGVETGWGMFVSARDDAALAANPGTTGEVAFEVQSWPGDVEWAAFVSDTVSAGVPVLSELIGQPWPLKRTLRVREALTPYLYGYAGWFDPTHDTIDVGEELDQDVVLHELSHAWFNRTLFEDRWLNEGMAQTYAAAAVAMLGGPADSPAPIDSAAPGALALVDWSTPPLEETSARPREAFGYNASWFVVDAVVDEIGVEAMSEVIAAADEGAIAYRGDGTPETMAGNVDWRSFLDLAEEVGGTTALEPLVRTYVAGPADQAALDTRAAARTEYDSLEQNGGEWAPPLAVRDAMADWDFDDATSEIDAAALVLAQRDDLVSAAGAVGLQPSGGFEATYEAVAGSPTDVVAELAGLESELDAHLAAVGRVEALQSAVDEAVNEFAPVGLVTDLGAVLDPVRAAFERGDVDSMDRLADEADAAIADQVDAARALRSAMAAEGADHGWLADLGLRGTQLDDRLGDGAAALAGGDTDTTRQIAADVQTTLDHAGSVGRRRALIGSGVTSWVVLALVTALLLARQRHRRRTRRAPL